MSFFSENFLNSIKSRLSAEREGLKFNDSLGLNCALIELLTDCEAVIQSTFGSQATMDEVKSLLTPISSIHPNVSTSIQTIDAYTKEEPK